MLGRHNENETKVNTPYPSEEQKKLARQTSREIHQQLPSNQEEWEASGGVLEPQPHHYRPVRNSVTPSSWHKNITTPEGRRSFVNTAGRPGGRK